MSRTKVAVVILNWNGKRFLEQFLPYVILYSKEFAEIIVADNNSTDNSVSFLQAAFPSVKIIINKDNGGFSKGYNLALNQIEADYFVLLNSDIEVSENWIQPIISMMESDDSIAACQPKILSYYNKDTFEYAGAAGGFIDYFGYPFCRGRIFQYLEKDTEQYNDTVEIFWATGACMFVRADVFRSLGGFDDYFFAHMEEIDLCWRIKNAGYKVMFCPESKVYHIGGGTLPKKNSRKTYLNFRNNLILLYKNLVTKRVYAVLLIRIVLDFFASAKFFFEGNVKDSWAVFKAYYSFYVNLKKFRKYRKIIVHRNVSCIYNKSIVFEHYFRKRKLFSRLTQRKFTS